VLSKKIQSIRGVYIPQDSAERWMRRKGLGRENKHELILSTKRFLTMCSYRSVAIQALKKVTLLRKPLYRPENEMKNDHENTRGIPGSTAKLLALHGYLMDFALRKNAQTAMRIHTQPPVSLRAWKGI
jgi:hypothetical protein